MKLNSRRFMALVLAAILMIVSVVTIYAVPPYPTALSANVDGNPSEWNLTTDFFANMYRAGETSGDLLAKLYLRYSCTGPTSGTLYALVLAEPGYMIDTIPHNLTIL